MLTYFALLYWLILHYCMDLFYIIILTYVTIILLNQVGEVLLQHGARPDLQANPNPQP